MTAYIIRRCLYAIPVLIGVNVIVFVLFFFVNKPIQIAEKHAEKRGTPEDLERFMRKHRLHLPYFYNAGWTRVTSLSAVRTSNQRTVSIKLPGRFRLTVLAPPNAEEARKAGTRRVRLTCSAPERLVLPPAIGDGDEDGFTFPPGTESRSITFEVRPGEGPVPELTIDFDLEATGLLHRVTLDYQESLGFTARFTETLFFQRSLKMLMFQYGKTVNDRFIGREMLNRIGPSLTITVPAFLVGLLLNIFLAMMLAYYRGTYVDYWGVFLCVILMSISLLFYIVGIQAVGGKILRLFPISGFDYGLASAKFVLMPIFIAVIGGLGGSVRFYRTIFLEEVNKDYVRTARAKGLPERTVLFVHVLKNAMIPILTSTVVSLPFLIMGSLLFESFFSIPGLGAYLLEGIREEDFFIVQAMVALGAFLYVTALLLTDISYTLVDPRVRLE